MPHGSRKNTSRKHQKPRVSVKMTETIDSETPSILIRRSSPPSSKKSTPKNRAPFQEPLPSPSSPKAEDPWSKVGMTEGEWRQHRLRVTQQLEQWRQEDQLYAEAEDWLRPQFWEQRLEILEMLREKYNRMRSWSSDVLREVEKLDEAIAESEYELNAMYDEQDRLEYMYD